MQSSQSACHYPAIPPPRGVSLTILPARPCGYLPLRAAQMRGFLCDTMPGGVYHDFMNAGFRRSGRLLYQPICAGCRACVPIRVPVVQFVPSRSQRRCLRRNEDLSTVVGDPQPSNEKYELYARYVRDRHDGGEEVSPETFVSFLYDSPVRTREFCYRDEAGRLLAVGLCDVCDHSLSSVYFYFDPADARRGLGTFGALREIDFARGNSIPFYYLGYHVGGCAAMQYKSDFRPHEFLGTDGVWRRDVP